MIISRAGNGKSIYATHWAYDFASYGNAGGWIIARTKDGASIFVQAGDDATAFSEEMDKAESAALAAIKAIAEAENWSQDFLDSMTDDARGKAWDSVMGALFEALEGDWLAPADAGGAPSSDGGFWGFYA